MEQFQAGDHVMVVRGPHAGLTGRIRRQKMTEGDALLVYIVDYDGSSEAGYHSPLELERI